MADKTDCLYMECALGLARRAEGRTLPNPMVGCVIVKNDRIIGQGWHRRCGAAHAEVVALAEAGARAQGATMYVTLEPCAHHGRTPPCVDQVIESRVARVVIASPDPNPRVSGRSIRRMRAAGIAVETGVMRAESETMNRFFYKYITTGMPFVTVKIAQTLDGKIATASGQSRWITSARTRAAAHRRRDAFDAIMVGVNTVLADDPVLNPVKKRQPWLKVILDSRLRIPIGSAILKGGQCLIATTGQASTRKINALMRRGADVLVCPSVRGRVDLLWLITVLGEREVSNLLIEGGARVVSAALIARIADRAMIFVAPKIIGDERALSAVCGLRPKTLSDALEIHPDRMDVIGSDIVIEGDVRYLSGGE